MTLSLIKTVSPGLDVSELKMEYIDGWTLPKDETRSSEEVIQSYLADLDFDLKDEEVSSQECEVVARVCRQWDENNT